MKKAMYQNRYDSINQVTSKVGELDAATATEISKHVNLSRQNILDVLKHAECIGYVTHTEEPYRFYKDGSILVSKKIWRATEYGLTNANWYMKAIEKYRNGKGMKPLL